MELINYLNEHFYTKQQLLELSKIPESVFEQWQSNGLMPKCSYKLALNVESDSFFGIHAEAHTVEYYAKGYTAWLGNLQSISDERSAYDLFSRRYQNAIAELKAQGFASQNSKVNDGLSQHIESEWQHFQNGIYGLCTQSGLPEDIAAKEFAIVIINELTEQENLTNAQLTQLDQAVNLLDGASALFAPHERNNSSRHRLVDKVRRKYQL
ncbi:DUF6058 family natural product biosynthesis protein [Pseudoalteromonas spongiae]|uniref:DUF6058 family natural product biosynthesis protein n=1 Tax=Pseudoalteromonas spongiae TaxID=298657 RepID=UPI00026C9E32|nr:DUF6058 family natural product biosynthesis protein [Pseudoalteromonas spongiae]ATD01511.1 hypothetical protein PSPO_b1701 [Pseudoalteromonas spongiae UST010723-006]